MKNYFRRELLMMSAIIWGPFLIGLAAVMAIVALRACGVIHFKLAY